MLWGCAHVCTYQGVRNVTFAASFEYVLSGLPHEQKMK